MEGITLDENTIRYLRFFEQVTGARAKDCIDSEDKIIFVVEKGEMGKAIGKKGEKVTNLRRLLKKSAIIVEHSEDPRVFIANVFGQFKVESVVLENRPRGVHATVKVDPSLKAKAIGRDGKNLRLARQVVRRHHPIESISVA